LPLYLVGGSWRALARFDMSLSHDPMPIVSGHRISVESVGRLARRLQRTSPSEFAAIEGLAEQRAQTLPDAATLLLALVEGMGISELVVSTSGLREGLLFQDLPDEVRRQDPLIVATIAEGRRFARFAQQGPAIERWIAPLFADDDPACARLRMAVCHLSDAASTANPDFRAERAVEMALHGQWLGIDLNDRMVMAQGLYSAAGGSAMAFAGGQAEPLARRLVRAREWGLAMRLAQRLSGGVDAPLAGSRIYRAGSDLVLELGGATFALAGEQVEKRLRQLASALGMDPKLVR